MKVLSNPGPLFHHLPSPSKPTSSPNEAPDTFAPLTTNRSEWLGKAAFGAAVLSGAALGYAGHAAYSLPTFGPAVSGVIGAAVGASAGTALTLASGIHPQPLKAGALIGMTAGALVGIAAGGTTPAGICMALAGATVPVGLLAALWPL